MREELGSDSSANQEQATRRRELHSFTKSQIMQTIDLKNAVMQIFQIVDQHAKRGERSPFFFIAGAGVSNPPIPLAGEIEEQCKQEARKYDDSSPLPSKAPMDSYSHWMGKAYPSPEGLQTYLREMMQRKPISKANLRLAHLLLDGKIARTVFTPNFDDLLLKALELFGHRPLVCDHPLTVGRIRIESKDVQIVHVHGSYWFYDCCNLKHEISARSEYGGPVSVLLDQSLRDHSPIVVGYSGWEGDILMSALRRRLSSGRLGTPIFWFCYKRESPDALPEWLKDSNDVKFVLPDEPAREASLPIASQMPEPKSQASPRPGVKAGIAESPFDWKAPTLAATSVLDALVRKFDPALPPLTQDPLGFYAKHLRELLGTGDSDGEQDTLYSFHSVIAKVERARDYYKADQEPDLLKGFRDAMSKADYRNAIKSASGVSLENLSQQERAELVFSLMDASMGLDDNSADKIAGYQILVRAADLLTAAGSTDPRLRILVSKALFNKGLALGSLGRSEEAIAVYDEVVSRFGDAEEPELRDPVASALGNKGVVLGILGRDEEAIAAYDDVVSRFGDAEEPELRGRVGITLVNKGLTLGSLRRSEEAIAVYDEVVSRFGDAEEPELRVQVGKALFNKGVTLGILGRSEEEIAVYDEVVSRFGDREEPELRALVARAIFNKGGRLGIRGRSEEEIAAYDEVVSRFGEREEPELRALVARALVNKGLTLGILDRNEEEIAVCDEVLSRFGNAQEPLLREQAAKALFIKGSAFETQGNKKSAIDSYEEALALYGDDKGAKIEELVSRTRNSLDNLLSEGEASA